MCHNQDPSTSFFFISQEPCSRNSGLTASVLMLSQGWAITEAPPDCHLFFTMLCSKFHFIKSCQSTTLPLIGTPGTCHRQNCSEGEDCSLLHRGEAVIKFKASVSSMPGPRGSFRLLLWKRFFSFQLPGTLTMLNSSHGYRLWCSSYSGHNGLRILCISCVIGGFVVAAIILLSSVSWYR